MCECRGSDGISIGGLDVELLNLEAPRKKEKWREAMQRTMKQYLGTLDALYKGEFGRITSLPLIEWTRSFQLK